MTLLTIICIVCAFNVSLTIQNFKKRKYFLMTINIIATIICYLAAMNLVFKS